MASYEDSSGVLFLLGASIVVGYGLHELMKRVEVDRRPLSIVGVAIGSTFTLTCGLSFLQELPFGAAFRLAWLVISCSVVSFIANMLLYRAFFHPLNRFPGPFGAKLSKFWALGKVVESKVRWYQVAGRLQEKYGDYVRTGPRELIIFDAEAINPILGFNSKARKGPFYGAMEQSLHTTRDHEFHRKRRRVWDMAFKQTLADYGSSIENFTDSLLARIEANIGQPVIINELCIHYSYDVMSSLAFGYSTKFLEGRSTQSATKILKNIQKGIVAVGALLQVPWMLTVVECISFAGPMMEFNNWSAEQVEKRRKIRNPRPDIMGHLLQHTDNSPAGRRMLNADSRVIIGAGRLVALPRTQSLRLLTQISDTTASALTILFVLLATYPYYHQKLREEVDISFQNGTYTPAKPQMLLDAIIAESLRLYPPVTFYSQRVTPLGGIMIGEIMIPENTIVSVATCQIHRDPRYFVQPNDFIPERWTSRPELVRNKEAYMPFSVGPYNCPGRALALMELRSVVARTLHAYDISLSDVANFDEKAFFDGIKDHFTAGIPKCEVIFKRRCF